MSLCLCVLFSDYDTSSLHFSGELSGTAQVLTDERSVTARLLNPLRYVWEKYL